MLPLDWTARHEGGLSVVIVRELVEPKRKTHICFSDLQRRYLRPSQLAYLVLGWAAVTVDAYGEGKGHL